MNCMKCGTELKTSGVFCPECLAEMEKYPVKPNITVQLPRRPSAGPSKKKARRQKHIKPEDQIRHLKKVRNWLVVLLITALLAFAASSLMVLRLMDDEGLDFGIGQNYGTVETTDETTGET